MSFCLPSFFDLYFSFCLPPLFSLSHLLSIYLNLNLMPLFLPHPSFFGLDFYLGFSSSFALPPFFSLHFSLNLLPLFGHIQTLWPPLFLWLLSPFQPLPFLCLFDFPHFFLLSIHFWPQIFFVLYFCPRISPLFSHPPLFDLPLIFDLPPLFGFHKLLQLTKS